MLPDFIIIGAMKAGTTSLYHYLYLHPEVGMSRLKETDYFIKEKNLDKGIKWYKSLFKGDFSHFGEASPNYSKAHFLGGVPREMHDVLPDIKLIYLVRNPIDRIVSHYTHNFASAREPLDMTEGLKDEENFNKYLGCSKYYWQLQQYLEYFSEDQILVVNSNKLRTDRKQILKDIFRFLEVDAFYTEEYEKEFGTSSNMSKKGKISKFITERSFMWMLRTYIPNDLKYKLKKMVLPTVKEKPAITPELKEKFATHLKDDVEALRNYTGDSYSEWEV